jgi:hypothetical protein
MALTTEPDRGWGVKSQFVEARDDGDFLKACTANPHSLVYFLLNVGDGDTQLLLLPQLPGRSRRAIVVDVATTEKLPTLVRQLQAAGLLDTGEDDDAARRPTFPVVVGSHPHNDHIGGMPQFLRLFKDRIGDYWEPGYFHTSQSYLETMVALEDAGESICHSQPTSGFSRFVDRVKLTVLTPGIGIRNRFDSYGVEINNASIALKIEFPAARVMEAPEGRKTDHKNRLYLDLAEPWSIILGADAQTAAWAQAEVDFPNLIRGDNTVLYKELSAAQGRDHLRGHIFKLPHHASKHGLNLELVERVQPLFALVSSVGGGGKYEFPHLLAVEAVREYFRVNRDRDGDDVQLGIHYTAALTERDGKPAHLGSMALVIPPQPGRPVQIWRFGEPRSEPVDLERASLMA